MFFIVEGKTFNQTATEHFGLFFLLGCRFLNSEKLQPAGFHYDFTFNQSKYVFPAVAGKEEKYSKH